MRPVAERYLRTLEGNSLEQPSSTPNSPNKPGSPRSPARLSTPKAAVSPSRLFNSGGPGSGPVSPTRTPNTRASQASPGKFSPEKLSLSPSRAPKNVPGAEKFQQELAGLGRKKLQHDDSAAHPRFSSATAWDKERKNLQAYEYLCHVGEAKEWMEDILGEELPDIISLPDSLQNGVTLAKVTRHFRPDLVRKVFEHPRLQYRHTENITAFIGFLKEVRVPDLFTFELIDVFEKKNIPRVIYCIHALSQILAEEHMAPNMGDLVGKLEFTDDQLSITQKGLDAVGGAPSFGMTGRQSRAKPREREPEPEPEPEPELEPQPEYQPEPVYADHVYKYSTRSVLADLRPEELMLMELEEVEPEIIDLQSVCRKCLTARKLSAVRASLAAFEPKVLRLQSAYRSAAVRQSLARHSKIIRGQSASQTITDFVSVVRGNAARAAFSHQKSQLRAHEAQILQLQSVARAVRVRVGLHTVSKATPEAQVARLQAIARGKLKRKSLSNTAQELERNASQIVQLQQAIRGRQARAKFNGHRDTLALAISPFVELQSVARGFLVRRAVEARRAELRAAALSITAVQSAFRGLYRRFSLGCVYDDLDQEILGIVGLQARAKGVLARKQFNGARESWVNHRKQVIQIQSVWRAKRQGDAYKSLIADPNPSLETIKRFVHLLNDTDADYQEEVDLEKARKELSTQVRNNEQLEAYIDKLDTKIALLLRNKISLDEVIQHQNQSPAQGVLRHNSAVGGSAVGPDRAPSLRGPGEKAFDLKALNKSSRDRLELYQGLFYILQTQPKYLSGLLKGFKADALSDREAKQLTDFVMRIFGGVNSTREEFFFLQLLAAAKRSEMRAERSLSDFVSTGHLSDRLLLKLNRRNASTAALRDILKAPLAKVFGTQGLDLESDPLVIYRNILAAEERSGRDSGRDPNATVDYAIQDPETRSQFVKNLQVLREISIGIIDSLQQNVDKIPYHVRYLASQMYMHGLKVFGPDSDHAGSVLAIVGHIVVRMFISPAIVGAENYGITSTPLDIYQTKSLNLLARIVNQASQLSAFGSEEVYLQPLNDFVVSCRDRFAELYRTIIDIQDPDQVYGMSSLDDITSCQRPVLSIKTSDILGIHSMVFQNLESIADPGDAVLRPVIKKLGPLPNDAREILDMARFTTVRLDLNPSYGSTILESSGGDSAGLLTQTKRCLVYVLRVQRGLDLMDVLVAPVEEEDEQEYAKILSQDKEKSAELSKLTFRDLKLLTLEKVLELESAGRISRETDYQELLNSLGSDIRNKHQRREARRRELVKCDEMLGNLKKKEEYLKGLQRTHNNYIEQAMATLQSQSQQKKKSPFPFTRKFFQQRELHKSGKSAKFGSFRSSADKSHDKGVLVYVKGYTERQYRDIALTFSCDVVATFNIEVAYKGILLPGATATLTLDDLLARQFNDQPYVDLFDDVVRFNTDRLLQFIFRKFYGATE